MSIKIGKFELWRTPNDAVAHGATHYATMYRVVPGFISEGDYPLWVSRSDLLNPIEDALNFMMCLIASSSGDESLFSFYVGRKIEQRQ